jgi:hypothetical protein
MPARLKHRKKKIARVFVEYGLHLWLLIFICNVVIFYAVRFFIFASPPEPIITNSSNNLSAVPSNAANGVIPTITFFVSPEASSSPTPRIPTPSPTATGPVVGLSFSLPGIGTNGGNLKPLHPEREVSVFLYNFDSNTTDKTVKPVYEIKTKATYDSDPNSSTYTFFVNPYIDLGVTASGNYQIAIQTPQALRQLIKQFGSTSDAGKIFGLSNKRFFNLDPQVMITGDIYPDPNSDNIMDINDYNMLVNCFSKKANSSQCPNNSRADIDDNGVVDGVDYNLMLLNFRSLLTMGFPVPSVFMPQTGTPTLESSPTISNFIVQPTLKPKIISQKTVSSSAGGLVVLFILFIIFGIVLFAAFKLHLFDKLLHRGLQESSASQVDQGVPVEEVPSQTGEQVVSSDIVEKTGYLKKVTVDAQANGIWVTLVDDNGITKGFYQGKDVTDGFVKIKGTIKNDSDNKPYILISEITPEV